MENTQQTQPEKKSWVKKTIRVVGKAALLVGVGYVCYKQGKDKEFIPGTCRKVKSTVFPTREADQALEPEMRSEEPVAAPTTSESYRQGQNGGFYRQGHGKFNNNSNN